MNEVQTARQKIALARKVAFTPEHPACQAVFAAWDELTEPEKAEVQDAYNHLWDWLCGIG